MVARSKSSAVSRPRRHLGMEIGELLERELCLGELLDIVRLGQEENQSEQILEVEERGQRQILQEQISIFT